MDVGAPLGNLVRAYVGNPTDHEQTLLDALVATSEAADAELAVAANSSFPQHAAGAAARATALYARAELLLALLARPRKMPEGGLGEHLSRARVLPDDA